MIAIDTNIILRLIIDDDHQQLEKAKHVLNTRNCFVFDSVLLECVWVLESTYKKGPKEITQSLATLLGIDTVSVANSSRVKVAFQWYVAGLDFADAFHLAQCDAFERFVTFDKPFIKRSIGKGRCPVVAPDDLV